MARIKDESVERVKATMEILPLVEDVVRLRKAGGTYKGLCPFHQERTPSFTVSPARGTFKCFGCGEGGDAITFVEKTENVDFVGAIELLAQRFGVELEYEEASPEQEQKRAARRPAAGAARACRRVLRAHALGLGGGRAARASTSPPAGSARRSAASSGSAMRRAAPGSRRARCRRATRRTSCARSGSRTAAATTTSSAGIVFPLADARGRVRGFQARKLHDDDPLQAKYVNSPEGELFRKGDLLYGLDTARQAIAREDRAVVVEGNTDVLALRQAAFAPVVASMGTALTEAQLRELARLTKRLFLCFDADAAGQDATLRGMELAVREGFTVRVVPLPPGTDPADDPAAFQERLAKPVSYPVHRVRLEHARATRPRERVRGDPRLPHLAARLARAPRGDPGRGRPPRPAARDAVGPRARARQRAHRRRRLAAAPRRRHAARAQRPRRRRRPRVAARRSSSCSGRSTSTTSCTGARARTCSGRRPPTAS